MTVVEAEATTETQDLTVDDFLTGLIAGMALNDVESVSIRGDEFYRAMADLFGILREDPATKALNVRFRIILDRTYRDSPVVRDAISAAVQRDLVSLDNPEYLDMRLKVGRDEAVLLLKQIPGPRELFTRLAAALVDNYSSVVMRRGSVLK